MNSHVYSEIEKIRFELRAMRERYARDFESLETQLAVLMPEDQGHRGYDWAEARRRIDAICKKRIKQ